MEKQEKNRKSRFLKITCPRCKKNKTIFGKSSTLVKCENCNYLLVKTKGGKSTIRAPVNEVISK